MAKVVYIPAKVRNAGIKELMGLVKIEGSFGIVTTVQHLDEVKDLEGYNVLGQVLGCNALVAMKENNVDNYLYIGSGMFHPLNLAFSVNKPVYVLDPLKRKFFKIDESLKQKYEGRKKGMLAKFYAANKVGVIVSIKSGQNNMNRALALEKKMKEMYPKKEVFMFLCDNVKDLENFPDIECWVNTACVRIFEDDLNVPLINIRDVENNLN